MYLVTREFSFDAAHNLREYCGKCSQTHGHQYFVEVTCSSSELDKLGMVIDFGILNQIMKDKIDRVYDHTMLNDVKPFDEINPTAENMARVFYDLIYDALCDLADGTEEIDNGCYPSYIQFEDRVIKLVSVRVWESDKSVAEYSRA